MDSGADEKRGRELQQKEGVVRWGRGLIQC